MYYKTENIKTIVFNYAAKLASLKGANFGDAPMCPFVQRLAWLLSLKPGPAQDLLGP